MFNQFLVGHHHGVQCSGTFVLFLVRGIALFVGCCGATLQAETMSLTTNQAASRKNQMHRNSGFGASLVRTWPAVSTTGDFEARDRANSNSKPDRSPNITTLNVDDVMSFRAQVMSFIPNQKSALPWRLGPMLTHRGKRASSRIRN